MPNSRGVSEIVSELLHINGEKGQQNCVSTQLFLGAVWYWAHDSKQTSYGLKQYRKQWYILSTDQQKQHDDQFTELEEGVPASEEHIKGNVY